MRYPVDVVLQDVVVDGKAVVRSGHGITLNISDSGILFTPDHDIPEGWNIRLRLRWPAAQDAVELRAAGQTVRSGGECCAVRISCAEFLPPAMRSREWS
jgi:hypothetical protein